MEQKYSNIVRGGTKEGLVLDESSERELLHKLMSEGVNRFLSSKIRQSIFDYEGNISEQPMLLAYPNSIEDKEMLNHIESRYISSLINEGFVKIDSAVYSNM